MNKKLKSFGKLLAVVTLSLACSGCDDPQVYGSVGVSSYSGGGYYGGRYGNNYNSNYGGGMHSSVTIGGRIR